MRQNIYPGYCRRWFRVDSGGFGWIRVVPCLSTYVAVCGTTFDDLGGVYMGNLDPG